MKFFLDVGVIAERGQGEPRVGDKVTTVIGRQVSHTHSRQVPAGRRAGVVVPHLHAFATILYLL